ncbi:3-ketoacyl-CoA thiolase with broad chain length specificity [Monosporozyma unispora]|nr:3-ketoacyl-CoA thiolase with broad chain length specificity [Kazachstania unispora]
MAQRLKDIKEHLQGSLTSDPVSSVIQKTPNDVVIVAAYRTPIARGMKGSLKDVNTDYILLQFLKQFIGKFPTNLQSNLTQIDEITCGNVLNVGAGATEHRASCLAAGLPHEIPFNAINRQCSSGLTAVNDIANKILTGQIDCGIALGVESMSQNYKNINSLGNISDSLKKDTNARKCLIPMGFTNENIVKKWGVTRETQDQFAALSYNKAQNSLDSNLFNDEILPIPLPTEDEDDEVTWFSKDEGPRPGVTPESLSKIKPAFIKNGGTTTAGNASQVSDGAAGVLLMRRSLAEKLDAKIVGKYVAFQCVGVPPEVMGVGPAFAIPKVLKQVGLSVNDVDIFEINEAFAAQCVFCIDHLKIPAEKVNPRGGAIALGHPLGCTGTRQIATIFNELTPGQIGVTSMCIGTGMGAAAIFVKE